MSTVKGKSKSDDKLDTLSNLSQVDSRKLLVERVASSRHMNRSVRLRDMLLYVSARVLDGETDEIHEQEVGHKVFGRPPTYDTSSDNIVRVHASLLRKRLEQYFAAEGADERIILEIPKGNYAPVFYERSAVPDPKISAAPLDEASRKDWRFRVAVFTAVLFAGSTVFMLIRGTRSRVPAATEAHSIVRQLWAQVFPLDRATDMVLDDAAIGLFQELSGRSLTLSDYFDRGYLRNLSETDSSIVLRRHASVATTSFLWKILQIPAVDRRRANLRFARDYSFRDLKADNAVLIGNARFNPWIEPFLPRLGIRWVFDSARGSYDPTDSWGTFKSEPVADSHEGYFSVALLPNLGGVGSVLIVSGTGGSALSAAGDFLADDHKLGELRRCLPGTTSQAFPNFEALIKVHGRSNQLGEASIALCRAPK
jgi:hypothetical protein